MSDDIPPEAAFELRLVFLRELDMGRKAALAARDRLLKDPNDPQALTEMWHFFHRIAGTAAQVGMPVLGHLAAICEDVLQLARDEVLRVPAKTMHIVSDGLAAITHVLDETDGAAGRSTPKMSMLGLAQPDALSDDRVLSKVLIIDDDPFSARLIDSCLRAAGLMSSYCCDPEQALANISNEQPDLIILDVAMPGLDGFDVCRRVRSTPALQFTPVIFVTRRGDLDQRVRGLEVGGNDYIAKPFEPQELVARVRSHLMRLSEIRNMAIRDGLTHCFNHKYFKTRLEQETARTRRYEDPLTIALLDIDFFKKINDTHGHPAGDAVLSQLANLVMGSVRSTDVVARYGGEEFGILFVQAGATEAGIITNRIRVRIAQHRFVADLSSAGSQVIPVTVSVGVSEFTKEDTMQSLLERADKALYQAKNSGRNSVRVINRAPPGTDVGEHPRS